MHPALRQRPPRSERHREGIARLHAGRALERQVRRLVSMPPRIEVNELGDLAVPFGAGRLALEHVATGDLCRSAR